MSLEDRLKKLKDSTSDSKKLRKNTRYSNINPEIIILLLEEGARMTEIAKIYGCSDQTLKYQMRIVDPDFDGRNYHKWRKRDITVETAVKLYDEIKSASKIAKLLNVEIHAITRRLKAAGIKLRPLYREDITVEKVVELYNKYKRTSKVAEILEINIPLVRRRLENAGIEIKRRRKTDPDYVFETKRTDIPVKQVLKLYDNEKSIRSIARKYTASLGIIKGILRSNGREIRKELPPQRPDLTLKRVTYWYGRIKSISGVAEKLETDTATIRKRLKKAGVYVKNFHKRTRTDIPIKKVKDLKKQGRSVSNIAKKYHTKRETIRRILDGYWD